MVEQQRKNGFREWAAELRTESDGRTAGARPSSPADSGPWPSRRPDDCPTVGEWETDSKETEIEESTRFGTLQATRPLLPLSPLSPLGRQILERSLRTGHLGIARDELAQLPLDEIHNLNAVYKSETKVGTATVRERVSRRNNGQETFSVTFAEYDSLTRDDLDGAIFEWAVTARGKRQEERERERERAVDGGAKEKEKLGSQYANGYPDGPWPPTPDELLGRPGVTKIYATRVDKPFTIDGLAVSTYIARTWSWLSRWVRPAR